MLFQISTCGHLAVATISAHVGGYFGGFFFFKQLVHVVEIGYHTGDYTEKVYVPVHDLTLV